MSDHNERSPVIVGSDQVTAGGASYNLSEIRSVSLIRPILTRSLGWGVAALGLIIAVLGYIVWGTFLTPMLAGIAMLIAGVVVALAVRESYTVRLNRAADHPVLIKFQNPNDAQRAVAEIGAAIASNRTAEPPPLEREIGA